MNQRIKLLFNIIIYIMIYSIYYRVRFLVLSTCILVLTSAQLVFAANPVAVDNLLINATFEHISVHLNILGDDNHNSSLQIDYKLTSASTYLEGAPTIRATPGMIVDGNALNLNFHAGSAMFLVPGQTYSIRLTLTDPDGGGTVINRTVTTRAMPSVAVNGQIKYVVPGSVGGNGSMANPFQGIQNAINTAAPGDIFEMAAGVYSPFTITTDGTATQPITIRSSDLHGAIVDGSNTSSGIITVGNFSDSTQHIIIDGLAIRNGEWAIDAQNTQYLTIQNNDIYDVEFGVYNRRENGWEHDQFITNNRLVGRTFWPQSGIPGERGIDIRGNRNVVSYNTIADFADGVSTDGAPYKEAYSLDIHNNDITRAVDDLLEVDGMVSNARVYQNRCYNGRAGISVAPVFGGPAYVFRNEFYNMENSSFKMNRKPAGLFIANNTCVKEGDGTSSPSGWQNTYLKNNAIVSSNYCIQEYGVVAGSTDDWDYNGYKSTRPATVAGPWFKWADVRYNNISDLKNGTSIETNGIAIDFTDFMNVFLPGAYANEIDPTTTDIHPSASSDLINAGISIANLDRPFVSDGMPDIGAIEVGQPAPQYGHDFTPNFCVQLKIMLEGPYNLTTGMMDDQLRQLNLIPNSEPYSALGFTYVNASANETIDNSTTVFSTTGPDAIVDWVFVELRAQNDPSQVVVARSGLLQRDGDVVEVDGVSPLSLENLSAGNYFVGVFHRNHLPVLSSTALSLSCDGATVDFTSAGVSVYGNNSRKEINGVFLLWTGDANQDQLVDSGDRSITWNFRNQTGYLSADLDLNGITDSGDRSLSWNNRNLSVAFP